MNYTYSIHPDEDAGSPREEFDNAATFVCFHNRYNLPCEADISSKDYDSWIEMHQGLERKYPGAVILPIYMYDHSGITISTTPFSCPWDSGQIGFAFMTREQIQREYNVKRVTKRIKALAEALIRSEVSIYDQYLRGDIWYYHIEDEDGNVVDSCGGFYGENWATQAAEEALAQWQNDSTNSSSTEN